MTIRIEREGTTLFTTGLATTVQRELLVQSTPAAVGAAHSMLEFLSDYLRQSERALLDGETIAYGTWLLQASLIDGRLRLSEFDPKTDAFVTPVVHAPLLYERQRERCRLFEQPFMPPYFHQKVAVSQGVLDGAKPVAGVRYPAPEHMSGWYLTDDAFDGDLGSLRGLHAWHFMRKVDAEFAGLLALPPGARFVLQADDSVSFRFDDAVAAEEP